jgi:hypothetical protein
MIFWVISSKMRNFLQKSKEIVKHIEAEVYDLQVEETFGVVSHYVFAVKLVKWSQITVPSKINYAYFMIRFCWKNHFPKIMLIRIENIDSHPFIRDR